MNASTILLDDEPPDPQQDGYDYTGGWKLVGYIQLRGNTEFNGTMEIPRNQIYLVKVHRKGDHTDYIILEKEEDRQLRNMSHDRVYLIWWQNLRTPIEYKAGLLKAQEIIDRREKKKALKKNKPKGGKKKL